MDTSIAEYIVDCYYNSAWKGDKEKFYSLFADDIKVSCMIASKDEIVSFSGIEKVREWYNMLFQKLSKDRTILLEKQVETIARENFQIVFSYHKYQQPNLKSPDVTVTKYDFSTFEIRETSVGAKIYKISTIRNQVNIS